MGTVSDDFPDLLKLSKAGFDHFEPERDFRGRRVLDSGGEDIGTVEDLYVDTEGKQPLLLEIVAVSSLAPGNRRFLIPVEALQSFDSNEVKLNQDRDKVANSPEYDYELDLKPQQQRDLYTYYGIR